MYNSREERVKTPLPEKLKNSFSFANKDDEQLLNEEELEQVMMDGNTYSDHHSSGTANNLDLFNQPLDMVGEEDNGGEITKSKKKRKKRKPKKDEQEEEELERFKENQHFEDNTVGQPIKGVEVETKQQLENSMEKDLFADMAKTHYLSISPNDIIVSKENEESTDVMMATIDESNQIDSKNLKIGVPLSLRQKTIFMENPVSGQFRRVKENDYSNNKHDSGEEIMEDEQEMIQREITSYNSTILITNNNLFSLLLFAQGLLAGICSLHLIINIPLYSNLTEFVEWYSPISTILQKIYMVFTCVCTVLSIYILSIELRPPLQKGSLFTELLIVQQSNAQQRKTRMFSTFVVRTLLIVGAACYTAAFLCSIVIGFADEYFAFYNSSIGKGWTSASLEKVTRNAIGWHVLNGVRALCSLAGWIAVNILFRALRRQSETSFQQLLKEQSTQ